MQMVNYLRRREMLRGEAFGIEGYTDGRPALEEQSPPISTVPEQMRVIGLVPQVLPDGGVLLVRVFLTNVPPTGG